MFPLGLTPLCCPPSTNTAGASSFSYQGQYVKGVKEGEGTETYAAPSTARDEDGDGDGGSGDGGSGDAQPAPDAVLVDGVDISGGW